MERYRKYMDSVEAPSHLHRRLTELEVPKGRPVWRRCGAMAAALVLVLGLGVYGVDRHGRREIPAGQENRPAAEVGREEPAIEPAVAPVDSLPEWVEGKHTVTDGGYEVGNGETVSYFFLPYIEYREKESASALSLAPPAGVERRELTGEEITALLGGAANVSAHLDWGDYRLEGHVMAYEDGSVWRAVVSGTAADGHFTLTLCPDALPQECAVLLGRPEHVTQVWGVEVTGWYGGVYGEGADREVWLPESREVELLAHDVGCRFAFYGPEGESERVETMVARFVRLAVLEGIRLDVLTVGD